MSNASKGRAFEHEVRKMLEASGYSVVRGAGSKGAFDCADGIVKPDLIASRRGTANRNEIQMILAQCKVRGNNSDSELISVEHRDVKWTRH